MSIPGTSESKYPDGPFNGSGGDSMVATKSSDWVTEDEWAAAAIAESFATAEPGEMPVELKQELSHSASQFTFPEPAQKRSSGSLKYLAITWATLAASLLIAIGAYQLGTDDRQVVVVTETDYDQLADTVRSPFAVTPDGSGPNAGDDYSKAKGEVIWNETVGGGEMRLSGLPVNDPKKSQYQLWIVDGTRSGAPVDGGVFDFVVDQDGFTKIPIEAKLPIGKASVFAITRETPGGVVVSEGPLLLAASM